MTAQLVDNSPKLQGFTAVRRDMVAALAATGLAVSKRPAAPVMSGVLVSSTATETTFASFDYETAVRVSIPAIGVTGRWLVPHAELTRMLAAAAKGERKAAADQMPVSLGTAPGSDEPVLSAGGFTLPLTGALDIDDYPDLPGRPEPVATVDREAFTVAVKRVMAACGTDDLLPVLTHIQMSVEDGMLRLETTDRFRITLATVPVDGPSVDAQALVPGKLLESAIKHLPEEKVTVHVGSPGDKAARRAVFVSGGVEVSARDLEAAEFPKIRSLLPSEASVTATVSVAALTKAARKAAALHAARNGDRNSAVEMVVSPTGVTVAPIVAEAKTEVTAPEVPADVAGVDDGDRFQTGFNPRFLLDMLTVFAGESITLHFGAPHKPMLTTDEPDGLSDPDAFKHLLMPRRLLS